MGHWNHRIVNRSNEYGPFFTIEEVYYDDDGSVRGHTENLCVGGESLEELKQTLEWMLKCLNDPIIEKQCPRGSGNNSDS